LSTPRDLASKSRISGLPEDRAKYINDELNKSSKLHSKKELENSEMMALRNDYLLVCASIMDDIASKAVDSREYMKDNAEQIKSKLKDRYDDAWKYYALDKPIIHKKGVYAKDKAIIDEAPMI